MAMKMAAAVAKETMASGLPPVGDRICELVDEVWDELGLGVVRISLEGDADGKGVRLELIEGVGSGETDELGVTVGVGFDITEGDGLGDTVGDWLGDGGGLNIVDGVAEGVEGEVTVGDGLRLIVGHGSHPFPMGDCPPSPKCSLYSET